MFTLLPTPRFYFHITGWLSCFFKLISGIAKPLKFLSGMFLPITLYRRSCRDRTQVTGFIMSASDQFTYSSCHGLSDRIVVNYIKCFIWYSQSNCKNTELALTSLSHFFLSSTISPINLSRVRESNSGQESCISLRTLYR